MNNATKPDAIRGEWVVLCRTNAARLAVIKAARAIGCQLTYVSRAQMRENTDASDRRAGIDPTPRAMLEGTRSQMDAFYASIPDNVAGVEGYEWVGL